MTIKTHIESYLMPAIFALGVLIGTLIYFILPFEVSLTFTALMSIFLMITLYFIRSYYKYFLLIFFVFASFLGLANSAWQIQGRAPNFLNEKYNGKRFWVVGQILDSASYNMRDKIVLENVKVFGINGKQPKKVRISSTKGRLAKFNIGDWVSLEARLSRPKNIESKSYFNFRRFAWIKEIGATGYVMGQIYKTSQLDGYKQNSYFIQHLRNFLASKIIADNETVNDAKSVMVGLVTGKKTYISPEIYNAYRSSGLAHLLAISGLHIGLIGGFVFFVSRRLFGMHEKITLAYNTKVPAAIVAIIVCLFYTLIAGSTLPTLRAFIMASFIFVGFILGKLHNTLRIFMLSLSLILLLWPESLITASFQMSFAAVFALTLWAEFKQKEFNSTLKITKGITYTKGVFFTSVIAGFATMPIVAWHFGEIHFTGFLANVLAIPLTAFLIMPSLLFAVLFSTFSFSEYIFKFTEISVGYLNDIAIYFANLNYGHYAFDKDEVGVLLIASLVLLVCFYLNKFKRYALILIVAVVIFSAYHEPDKGKIIVLRSGKTVLLGGTNSSYSKIKADNSSEEKYLLKRFKLNDKIVSSCDFSGCVYKSSKVSFLFLNEGEVANAEDCKQVNYIIALNTNIKINCLNVYAPKNITSGELYLTNNKPIIKPYIFDKKRIWH